MLWVRMPFALRLSGVAEVDDRASDQRARLGPVAGDRRAERPGVVQMA